MCRKLTVGMSIAGALLLAGCASYTKIAKPWVGTSSVGEFDTRVRAETGDRARITMVDKRELTGIIVEIDSLAITVMDQLSEGKPEVLPAAAIVTLEVYRPASWKPVRTVVLVTAGALATYFVVDELTNQPIATPAWGPVKHGVRH